MVMGLAGSEGDGSHGAPVEGAEESDKVVPLGMKLCQLDGGLDGFCPGVGQECLCTFFERSNLIQFLTQADPAFVIEIRRNVQELFGGLLHGSDNSWICMSSRKHRDARHEVKETISIRVPNLHTLAMIHHEWVAARVGG